MISYLGFVNGLILEGGDNCTLFSICLKCNLWIAQSMEDITSYFSKNGKWFLSFKMIKWLNEL